MAIYDRVIGRARHTGGTREVRGSSKRWPSWSDWGRKGGGTVARCCRDGSMLCRLSRDGDVVDRGRRLDKALAAATLLLELSSFPQRSSSSSSASPLMAAALD